MLADVGCNVPVLDDHDRRVIDETRDGTTTYKGSITGLPGLPDSQNDVGGWEDYPEEHRPADWDTDNDGMPDAWETEHGLNPSDAGDGHARCRTATATRISKSISTASPLLLIAAAQ